jgi:hypothetical protein
MAKIGIGTREILAREHRNLKRFARLLLILIMALPLAYWGPLLWKDGSVKGRWEFIADSDVRPADCWGVPYLLQGCQIKFADRPGGRLSNLNYLTTATDWMGVKPDLVRNTEGNYSSSIGVTGEGIVKRSGALALLLAIGFLIEQIILRIHWNRVLSLEPVDDTASPQSNETTILSRDRRDHL